MSSLKATVAADSLLRDKEVTERLGLDPACAYRLSLALVVDAESASGLAGVLLANHAEGIDEFER